MEAWKQKTGWAAGALVGALIILCLLFWSPIVNSLQATALFVNIAIQDGEWRPLELLTDAPEVERSVFQSASGRNVAIDIYKPIGEERRPGILVYTPLAGGGHQDPRLVNFAESLARIGFVAMVPWHESEATILSEDDVAEIIGSFERLHRHQRVDQSRVGFFAMSYGNGPVFLAAADSRIREDVDFIASYAGYYDLSNAMRYVLSGEYAYQDIREELEPEDWVKGLLVENLMYYGLQQSVIDELFQNPDRFDAVMNEYPEVEKRVEAFSPSTVVDTIDSPTFIAHSTGDHTIPWTEALRLRDGLREHGVPVTTSIVSIFIHGELVPLNVRTLFEDYIPSLFSGFQFLYEVTSI